MDLEKQKYYEKTIKTLLNYVRKGIYPIEKSNPFNLQKKGVSPYYIATVVVDYALEHDILSTNLENFILDDGTHNLAPLLYDNEGIDKITRLFDKYRGNFYYYSYLGLLKDSNLSLNFFIKTEDFFIDTISLKGRTSKLYDLIDENFQWDDDNVKKFMIYFLSNDTFYEQSIRPLMNVFYKLGRVLKKFLIDEKSFADNITEEFSISKINEFLTSLSYNDTIEELNEEIIKKVLEKVLVSYDIEEITNLYITSNGKLKPYIFSSTEKFYDFLIKAAYESDNLSKLLVTIENWFDFTEINEFFSRYPNFIEIFKDKTDIGDLITLKFSSLSEYVPDSIKNQIELPTTEKVVFDGDDILSMMYGSRDSNDVYVKYYVDNTLWDHTHDWDYEVTRSDIFTYHWKDINERNMDKIKEYVKKNHPDVNVDDEEELQVAIDENDELMLILKSAAFDGMHNGDENQLIKDIYNVLNELFGKGNWEQSDEGIVATISISDIDSRTIKDILDSYCDWDVRCIWKSFKEDYVDRRKKPDLPEYRYGIQGDFDVDAFNDRISDEL